jgi:hypothetical protein
MSALSKPGKAVFRTEFIPVQVRRGLLTVYYLAI